MSKWTPIIGVSDLKVGNVFKKLYDSRLYTVVFVTPEIVFSTYISDNGKTCGAAHETDTYAMYSFELLEGSSTNVSFDALEPGDVVEVYEKEKLVNKLIVKSKPLVDPENDTYVFAISYNRLPVVWYNTTIAGGVNIGHYKYTLVGRKAT